MTTKTLEKEVGELKKEVKLLRSVVIGIIGEKDPEGEYRPEFVRSVLKAMKEAPAYTYKGKGSLVRQIQQMQ
ncbi:MAG: hypothetical protein Q8R36_04295 [bacterium]|nr:hypothetical protein [bacterium]